MQGSEGMAPASPVHLNSSEPQFLLCLYLSCGCKKPPQQLGSPKLLAAQLLHPIWPCTQVRIKGQLPTLTSSTQGSHRHKEQTKGQVQSGGGMALRGRRRGPLTFSAAFPLLGSIEVNLVFDCRNYLQFGLWLILFFHFITKLLLLFLA